MRGSNSRAVRSRPEPKSDVLTLARLPSPGNVRDVVRDPREHSRHVWLCLRGVPLLLCTSPPLFVTDDTCPSFGALGERGGSPHRRSVSQSPRSPAVPMRHAGPPHSLNYINTAPYPVTSISPSPQPPWVPGNHCSTLFLWVPFV